MIHFFKRPIYFIATTLLIIISISCTTTKSLVIEIPKKSKKELPQSIQSLTLVNRTITNSFTNLDPDSLQKIFYRHNFNYDTIVNDIQASDTTLKALGELLFESGRYDFVIPKNHFLKPYKNSFPNTALPWKKVRELCETYNTDAVLSLDYLKTRVSTNYTKESFYDQELDGFFWVSAAHIKIYYEALFRVYDPIEEKIVLEEFMRDTLYWNDMNRTVEELFREFTPIKTALNETGISIALDFSEKISTTWNKEQRIFFCKGDERLKQAAQFVDEGKWETAMVLWTGITKDSKSKSAKSKAEFNLAVGCELQGNLDNAINWALKSYNTMYRQVTYNYLKTLKKRKNKIGNAG
jgi:hypothetical protein